MRAISDAVSKKDDSIDVEHLVLTATQTFILQMSGFGSYLPTERAQAGGHYSAVPQSNIIGQEGGQVLVDRSVELINSMW